MVICLERGTNLHMAQLMPLPLTVSCFSKIWIGSTFQVPDSPRKRAVKWVSVCVILLYNQHLKVNIFTTRCYACAVLAMGLCLSQVGVLLKRLNTGSHKKPHDSPWTLVFWCQTSPQNSTGVTPYRGNKCRQSGLKSATFDKQLAISRNGTR